MSDLTGNKIAAAGLLAALLFFGTKTLIHELSHETHGIEKAHKAEKYAYSIDIPEKPAAGAVIKKAHIDLGALLASADPERGKVVAKKCAACHTFNKDGKTLTGPNLWDIIGRIAASKKGFVYSSGMKTFAKEWNYEHLFYFLENPRKYVKGTAMSFAGIRKPKDRAALLAYLNTMADKPVAFPKPDPKPETPKSTPETKATPSSETDKKKVKEQNSVEKEKKEEEKPSGH